MILCQTDSVIVSYTSLGAKNTNETIGELLFSIRDLVQF